MEILIKFHKTYKQITGISLAEKVSILKSVLKRKMEKEFVLTICVSTRGNELLMQLLHSRKLCFHKDYDTTDLGLKLEYSDLN